MLTEGFLEEMGLIGSEFVLVNIRRWVAGWCFLMILLKYTWIMLHEQQTENKILLRQ